MGVYIQDVDMPKQDEILQIRIYGDGKVSRVYDIECQQIGTAIETTKEKAMTRDEAIKVLTYLREIIKEIPKALCKLPNVEERKRENIIALRMAIESLQVDAEWIPCSERLPNTNGIYIVTRRKSDGFECRNRTDACYFDGTSTWHDDALNERKCLADVLAWMPLPMPYREDDEA